MSVFTAMRKSKAQRNSALIYNEEKKPVSVVLHHVSKIYEDPKTHRHFYAAKDVNLTIAPGEFVTLLGPSGCGKTTTLRMIAGFESPNEGQVYIGGVPVNALTPNQRYTAMVFQSYALFPHYNVFDNVAYGLKLRSLAVPKKDEQGNPVLEIDAARVNQLHKIIKDLEARLKKAEGDQEKAELEEELAKQQAYLEEASSTPVQAYDYRSFTKEEIQDKVMAMLDLVELKGMEQRMTNQLSGGQQQRVALARALVLNPSVLLFDEPLSNLDAKLRVSMRTEIRRIQQKIGITAVYVTHDQSEAMAISDRVIVMNKGVVQQVDSPKDIYYHPTSKFVADFIGEANFLSGKVVSELPGEKIDVAVGEEHYEVANSFHFGVGEDVQLLLRPESVHLDDDKGLPCKVEVSTFMGAYQLYHVRCGEDLVNISEYNPRQKKIYAVGDDARLLFDEGDVHVLPRHAPLNDTIYLD